MTTERGRWTWAVGMVATLGVGLWARPGGGTAPPTGPAAAAGPGRVSPGIDACRSCHNGADAGDAPGFVQQHRSNQFVLLNEAVTWTRKGVHSIAFANLSGPLGRRMEAVLKYPVAEDSRCLSCHAVDLAPAKRGEKTRADFATTAGVSCTGCHGLGRDWQFDHYEESAPGEGPLPWREKDPAAKRDRGMVDLRDPAVKGRACASCHVGNPDEGKVITHEMYAAGHPPLPPFELASFMESEPRHWGYPEELPYFKEFAASRPTDVWKVFHYHPADREVYLARQLAAGAAAALEAEMRLVASDAEVAKETETGIDFARFDCYACHHELKVPSPRQERGYDGPPGRVPPQAWAGALPAMVAEHAKGLDDPKLKALGETFEPAWAAVRRAAVARPFGDPAALRTAADALGRWCHDFLALQSTTAAAVYTPAQAARLLRMIGAAAPLSAADPDAALQLTWAYVTLREAIDGRPIPPGELDGLAKVIDVRVRRPNPPGSDRPPVLEESLSRRMRRIADYDPAAFAAAFRGLCPAAGR